MSMQKEKAIYTSKNTKIFDSVGFEEIMTANIARLKKFRLRQRRKNTKLTDLPFDILVNILKRLPVKSLWRIRCVSEIFKNIVHDRYFATLHTRLLFATNSVAEVPQLILNNNSGVTFLAAVQLCEYNSNSSLKETKHAVVSELEFKSFSTWISQQFVFCNLFCFKVENCESPYCILFDHFKGEVLPLPMSDVQIPEEHCIYDKYGMGFDDLTSTHKVIRVSADIQKNMVALVKRTTVFGRAHRSTIHIPHQISTLENWENLNRPQWVVGPVKLDIDNSGKRMEWICDRRVGGDGVGSINIDFIH